MSPIEKFESERQQRIAANGGDENFQALAHDWIREAMQRMYVYNFQSLGRPIIQFPEDMVAIQELIWSVKPDLIIETGIAHGGSLIQSAMMLSMLDVCEAAQANTVMDPNKPKRKVLGIDIDIRDHNRAEIEKHPLNNYIQMLQGSAIEPAITDQVANIASGYETVLVFLDSMHTHDHVMAELEAYAPLTSIGSYCVVFDTLVEDMPKGFYEDRPWDVGNNPKTAAREWLKSNPNFKVDQSIHDQLMITVAHEGYLKRTS